MNPTVVQTYDLSYTVGGKEIIRGLDLVVPRGSIFGLLGQNGSGKSTTLKLLLGLLPGSRGTVELFGVPVAPRQPTFYSRIGSLIEMPSIYPHLSAYDNLRISASYRGLKVDAIREALSMVQLEDAVDQRVGTFSTGMRQRLGIAQALLADPDLLLLDEPTNGLDPQGISIIRSLILRLNRAGGKTVILSSHLLSEVERICTRVGVLNQGRLLYQGTIEELRSTFRPEVQLEIETDAPDEAISVLKGLGLSLFQSDETLRISIRHKDEIPAIIDELRLAGIAIYEIRRSRVSLEELYLAMT